MWLLRLLTGLAFLVTAAYGTVANDTRCPDPDDILPCLCFDDYYLTLVCQDVTNTGDLLNAFENSRGMTYDQVHLQFCDLHYLPTEMFDYVNITFIRLINVTMITLFDKEPGDLGNLKEIFIKNVQVHSRLTWSQMEIFTGLKYLVVRRMYIPKLTLEFDRYVSHKLSQINFVITGTKLIVDRALENFTELEYIAMDDGEISVLKRNMFPRPAKLKFFYFANNRISSLPEDLFVDMPDLRSVSFSENDLSILSEATFSGIWNNLFYLTVRHNPIKCDCSMRWMARRNKPEMLMGHCWSPKILHGKELKSLGDENINCDPENEVFE